LYLQKTVHVHKEEEEEEEEEGTDRIQRKEGKLFHTYVSLAC
jgi:hypothetical protein